MLRNIKIIILGIVLLLAVGLCLTIFGPHTLDLFGRENFATYIIFFVGCALILGGGIYWGDKIEGYIDRKENKELEDVPFKIIKEEVKEKMTPEELEFMQRIEERAIEVIKRKEKTSWFW